jgi:chromosome partitioning protein
MSVICIGTEKGGTGKSTLTQSISALRVGLNYRVAVVDFDNQGTTALWADTRDEDQGLKSIKLAVPQYNSKVSHADYFAGFITDLAASYDDVFIDVGGKDYDVFRAALVAADKIVVPLEPSPADLNTMPPFAALVDELQKLIGRKFDVGVVLNKADDSPIMLAGMLEGMGQFKKVVPLMKTQVGNRAAFKRATEEGRGVTELVRVKGKTKPDLAAMNEIKDLYLEIFGK